MANVLREDSDYLEAEAQRIFEEQVLENTNETIKLDIEELKGTHSSLVKRLIRMAIKTLAGTLEGIDNVHIEDILSLIKNSKNQLKLNLPKGLMVYKTTDGLIFTFEEISFENVNYNYILKPDGYIQIDEIGMRIESKIMSKERCIALPTGQYTKAFDYDKIKGDLIVRSRLDGDRMKPMGLGGTKKLKDIFIDLKIPREKRNSIAVLSDDKGILWLMGHKISEDYKIDENTKRVIRITCKTL
jgi:tRNA(Ile)-lysidine synthase